jgi:hypothetical protein
METALRDLFENPGLIVDGKPVFKRIQKANLHLIADLCRQSGEISSYENIHPVPSLFSHTASLPLGGGTFPCSSTLCRLQKIKELAQFAALYSDKVYIKNFLYDIANEEVLTKVGKDRVVKLFEDHLIVFSTLLPLIETGKVQLVTFKRFCPHCLSLRSLEQNAGPQYDKASKDLEKRYYSEVTYSLQYREGDLHLISRGPDILVPHGEIYTQIVGLTQLANLPTRLIEKTKIGGEVILTPAQAKKIEAATHFVTPVINSIAFELGGAHFLKTSYLSESDLEVNFIRNVTIDPIARRRTALMMKYLTCLIPFIDSVDTSKLITLRQDEQESFALFRSALNKAIDEYKVHGDTFTQRDAQAVYADIVQPRLAALDAKIRAAKQRFAKKTMREILGWTGAISFGYYTGIFTGSPFTGAAAFAAVKAGEKLLESTMTKSDVKESIKQDDMYFLWRVKELAHTRDSIESMPNIFDHK